MTDSTPPSCSSDLHISWDPAGAIPPEEHHEDTWALSEDNATALAITNDVLTHDERQRVTVGCALEGAVLTVGLRREGVVTFTESTPVADEADVELDTARAVRDMLVEDVAEARPQCRSHRRVLELRRTARSVVWECPAGHEVAPVGQLDS